MSPSVSSGACAAAPFRRDGRTSAWWCSPVAGSAAADDVGAAAPSPSLLLSPSSSLSPPADDDECSPVLAHPPASGRCAAVLRGLRTRVRRLFSFGSPSAREPRRPRARLRKRVVPASVAAAAAAAAAATAPPVREFVRLSGHRVDLFPELRRRDSSAPVSRYFVPPSGSAPSAVPGSSAGAASPLGSASVAAAASASASGSASGSGLCSSGSSRARVPRTVVTPAPVPVFPAIFLPSEDDDDVVVGGDEEGGAEGRTGSADPWDAFYQSRTWAEMLADAESLPPDVREELEERAWRADTWRRDYTRFAKVLLKAHGERWRDELGSAAPAA